MAGREEMAFERLTGSSGLTCGVGNDTFVRTGESPAAWKGYVSLSSALI